MSLIGLCLGLFGLFSARPAQATTCAGATVLTYQNYPAFSITCGAGNDINSGNATVCGSTSYLGGQEALYTFTSLGSGAASFAYSGLAWTGIQLWAGCPTMGGTCVASVTSSSSAKTLNATLVNGTVYYLMVDTWPTPDSPCPGTLTISVPPAEPPCSGVPNPGNTTGPGGACTGQSFTLGVQNTTVGTGVSYVWEYDNGGGWTVFGTNSATQSTTQTVATSYRATVTCAGNGSTTSNALSIPMNGYLNCYCIPTTTNGCLSGDHITNVTFVTINNSTGTCLSASYSNYMGISTTVGQTQNVAISATINNGGTEYGGAWIDYDHSGTFDAAEFIVLNGGLGMSGGVFSGSVSIPAGALLGPTGLRVRSSYNLAIGATSACANYSYGETEDYTVVIDPPPSCLSPTVSNSAVTATSADISWTCGGCTGSYYVEYGPTGFTPGTGATANGGTLWTGGAVPGSPVTITGLSGSTTYTAYVRQDCGGGSFSSNTGTSFTTLLDCATAPVVPCSTPTSFSIASGSGVWHLGPAYCSPPGSASGPYCTPGKEKIWQFNAPYAGIYVLNVTTTNSAWVDYLFKSAAGTCDPSGWTYINDVFSPEQANFTIAAPGTYYLVADLEGTGGAAQTFQITCPLPCATPQGPNATNVTSVAAQINWTCTGCTGDEFIVEYGLNGFAPGTGTPVLATTSPAPISGLSPSTTYQAYVRQDCDNVGDGLSNWSNVVTFTTLAPPPANDECAGAIPIACNSSTPGTTANATADALPSQVSGGCSSIANGVWYAYAPSVDGELVTASTCDGLFHDTRIHIFRGSCGSLIGVAGNDDAGAACPSNGTSSTVSWNALPGFTYYIVVENYTAACTFPSSGPFTLSLTCAPLCTPLVANDACVDAQPIAMTSNCIPFGGNLSCATSTAGNNPSCIGGFNTYPDAYYTFQATATDAFVTLTGGANLGFTIYDGTSCTITDANHIWCSTNVTSGQPILVTGLTNGNTYTMRVFQLQATAGTFSLCVQKLDVSDDPCTAVPLVCGDLRFGRTVGRANNLPAGACPFNGPASTGGVNYFIYAADADEDVTFSTCGQTAFNTRLSVYSMTDCNDLTCNVMGDDAPGCPGNSSEVTVRAQTGQSYLVLVHGSGAAEGNYQLSVFCQPYCSITEANDRCANAIPLTTYVTSDPLAAHITAQQGCSYADAPTGCSAATFVQGVWYTFNSGPNTVFDIHVATNAQSSEYTATTMNYALYGGACTGVGASSEMTCLSGASGSYALPVLTPNTDYRMLFYNTGGTAEGTFGLMITHPGYNDAGIVQVDWPTGTVCDQKYVPAVWLKNFGENPLSSAQIISRIDGGIVQTYDWTGGPIDRGDSLLVVLPLVSSPTGLHTYTAEALQPNGAVDELASNNAASAAYDATGQTLKVQVRTDAFGGQTSWTVYDAFFFPVGQAAPGTLPSNAVTTTEICLPTSFGNCFYFFLFDSNGDGLCCANGNGLWKLLNVEDEVILADNGQFTDQSPAVTPLTSSYFAHEFCLPLGPASPMSNECEIYSNLLQNKVYANTVPGVVNYQFEFSDPDNGFRRRIALPRNWVKFGEMVTSPLTPGVTYFCRVRVDQGATGFSDDYFGKGCDMAMSILQPVCTGLISTPGSTYSCGVTKTFGGSDKIWAQPVPYATQYRFNFSRPGYTRNILRPSYVCLLSWVTSPLVSGNTYDVKVEALVGSTWSGYCGEVCQVTILNTPGIMEGGGEEEGSGSNDGALRLWPNPVRDGRVNLFVNGIADEDQRITVDVYDIYGKRVMTAQYGNSGEVFNTVLALDPSIAVGVYTVNITVNDRLYTRQLSVQ